MFCKHCGSFINEGEKNCPNCKAPLEPLHQGKAGFPLWLKVLLLILIPLLLIAGFFYFSENATETVEGQLKAIRSGQLTEAYYEYTSKEFQKATSLDSFKEFVKSLQPFIEKEAASSDETSLNNETKRVREIFLAQDNTKLTIDFLLIKEDEEWKIQNIRLSSTEDEEPNLTENESVTPIVNLLENFKKQQVDLAYRDYTSPEFQKATSLKELKEFLKNFPVFEKYTSYDILDLHKKGNLAQAVVLFHDGQKKTYTLFSLSVDGKIWKIHGIEIAKKEGDEIPESFSSEDLIHVIQGQLDAIKAGDLKRAYEKFTSQSFREVTSFEAFERFVKSYPVFSENRTSNFHKLSFNNNIAVFSGELADQKETREVEFYLDREDGEWKVIQIHILEKGALDKNSSKPAAATIGA